MQIVFNLPHVFSRDSSRLANARALRCLLECMVELDIAYLRDNPNTPDIYSAGVVYDRTTDWEPISGVLLRGYGDCKSLAPWLVAQYRRAGVPCRPVFRFVDQPDGSKAFHILVQTARGYEDPSRMLGMGANENARPRRASG